MFPNHCKKNLVFAVRWRKNIFLLLSFGRKEEEFYFAILEDPLREVDKKKASSFSSSSILGKKNLKRISVYSIKEEGRLQKNPKLFSPKRRRKTYSLNFHCSKKKKKKKEIFTSILLRRKKKSDSSPLNNVSAKV